MRMSDRGIRLIQDFEGYGPFWYRDAVGAWTIGYGHASNAEHDCHRWLHGIAKDEAMGLLRQDLFRFEVATTSMLTRSTNENQFDALCSLVYNCGPGNVASSHLLAAINADADEAAIRPLWMTWCHAGGKELAGLKLRRSRELALYLTPVDDAIDVDETMARVYSMAARMVADSSVFG